MLFLRRSGTFPAGFTFLVASSSRILACFAHEARVLVESPVEHESLFVVEGAMRTVFAVCLSSNPANRLKSPRFAFFAFCVAFSLCVRARFAVRAFSRRFRTRILPGVAFRAVLTAQFRNRYAPGTASFAFARRFRIRVTSSCASLAFVRCWRAREFPFVTSITRSAGF